MSKEEQKNTQGIGGNGIYDKNTAWEFGKEV